MDQSHLVAKPVVAARKRKRLAPSKISGPLVFLGRYISWPYLKLALKFQKIEIRNAEAIVQALSEFQQKRTRLIIAFRHPYGDEPQLLFHVFERMLPRCARKLHKPLKARPRMRPVHDYAVALWGDAVIRFILPRVGALPVYHTKIDTESLNAIRGVMRNGKSPLGIASEGQISYHADTLPRIEQGTIRMGLWCARDLEKEGRPEQVVVLPLSVHYRYPIKEMRKIRAALARIDALCGLNAPQASVIEKTPESLLPRIERIEDRLLQITETYYIETYGYRPGEPTASGAANAQTRHERWEALLPFALTVAEHILGMDPGKDDPLQRMYRVRQTGWDRVYPENPAEGQSPVEAALADRRAGEAWYAMRHMELFDLMSYDDPAYLRADRLPGPLFDRVVETVTTLEDLACRLMGGNITNRPNAIRKKAVLVPGETINLTQSLPQYHANAKRTVQALTEELTVKFLDCIREVRNGEN
jgi:hypothetical protein